MLPSHYKLVYSAAQIAQAVNRLAGEVSIWAAAVRQATGQDVVAVPVLRGGVFFYCDLVRQVSESLELVTVKTWAYVERENAAELGQVRIDMGSFNPQGRAVMLVDDICDSGRTLAALKDAMGEAGATEVRSAALIRRLLPGVNIKPDWCGFEYNGPEWFVGYGMDDSDRWRNLPDVYTIQKG